MKKLVAIIVVAALIFSGLQIVEKAKKSKMSETERNLIEFFEQDGNIISVLMPYSYYVSRRSPYSEVSGLMNTIIMKEFDYNDKIWSEIIPLDVETYEDYQKAKNILLQAENGPTLIFIDKRSESTEVYLDNYLAEYIPDKLKNYENIYDFLKNDYFIPLGIYSYGTVVKTEVIEEMGLEIPDENWSFDDYYNILNLWFEDNDVYMNSYEYDRIYNYYFSKNEFVDLTGKVYFNIPENIDKIKIMRERFVSNDFIVESNISESEILAIINGEDSSTDDYYRVRNEKNHFVNDGYFLNVLNPFSTYHPLLYRPLKLLPKVNEGTGVVFEFGAIVNINGANKDEGYRLLDYMLSDKYQFYVYEKKLMNGIAPSIKTIEDEIKNKHPRSIGSVEMKIPQESFDTRDKLIELLSNGTIKTVNYTRAEMYIQFGFKRAVAEIVLSDLYLSDGEIENKLKEFEREVYLYINE